MYPYTEQKYQPHQVDNINYKRKHADDKEELTYVIKTVASVT
jgi:hypothetical protein